MTSATRRRRSAASKIARSPSVPTRVIECDLIEAESRIGHALECSFAVGESSQYGQACVDASEAVYACIAAALCDQIDSGVACDDKEAEQKMICGF